MQLNPVVQFEDKLRLLSQARDNGELAEQDFTQAATELKAQYLQSQQSQQTTCKFCNSLGAGHFVACGCGHSSTVQPDRPLYATEELADCAATAHRLMASGPC